MASRLESVYKARAQVMSRDDGTGLWRRHHGGGMSVIHVARLPPAADAADDDVIDHVTVHDPPQQRYYVIGHKDSDVSRHRLRHISRLLTGVSPPHSS